MRASHLIFSSVHLLVTLLIVALGLVLLIFPYAEPMRYALANFLLAWPGFFFSLGLFLVISGSFLMVAFYFLHRKRYYKLSLGCGQAAIDEAIIREYVLDYWRTLFPHQREEPEIVLTSGQRIEIITQLPKSVEDQSEIFERIKNELGVLLARRLGYKKDFILTITG